MKALILAAGFATRLYPITKNTAKPLLNVKGRPIIENILEKIGEIPRVDETIVVTNKKFYGDFMAWRNSRNNITILNDGTRRNEERLGAIGDIFLAIKDKKINEDLLVMAGDNYFTCSLKEPYEIFEKRRQDLSFFYDVGDVEKAKRLGVAEIQNGILTGFEEKPENPKTTICSAAAYFYRKETLELFQQSEEELREHDPPGYLLSWLYKKAPVYAYVVDKWIDIGNLEALAETNQS